MPVSESTDPAVYERGDALDEVISRQQTSDGLSPADVAEDDAEQAKVYELSEDEYWEWLAALMEDGSALDESLDDLLEEVYDLEPAFYSPTGRRQLRDLLGRLHEVRTSVRAFERDVEQLSFVFAKTDTVETGGADNAELILSRIKRTYASSGPTTSASTSSTA